MNIRLLLILIITIVSCSVEDEDTFIDPLSDFTEQRFVSKILPDNEGYWLITSSVSDRSCSYCSALNFINGIAYVRGDRAVNKDKIAYFLGAEIKNDQLWALTSSEIINFNRTLESSTIVKAEKNEIFLRMTKDDADRIWVFSNKRLFCQENGEKLNYPNTIPAMDFEAGRDQSFWISSSDTVYHLKKNLNINKFSLKEISGTKNNIASIYGLKIDKNDSIWINTSENIYMYRGENWKIVKTDAFSVDNFKTIPFMDVDNNGNVWLAEKNYQAFTTLHCYNGTSWSSYKLTPPLESWITDIETAGPGSIWIGSTQGLQKLSIN